MTRGTTVAVGVVSGLACLLLLHFANALIFAETRSVPFVVLLAVSVVVGVLVARLPPRPRS